MSAGQPGIFINHAAQKFPEIGISAFPKHLKRPCRRNNRIIVNAEFGSQLSQMIRKSGSAGYAVNQAFCPFQNTGQNSFGICQFPQHIHVDPSVSAGNLIRYLSLGDAALNCVFNHFFMAVGALFLIEMFNNDVSVFIIKIRAHAGKSTDAVFMCPGTAAASVTGVNSFSAFNQRQNFFAGNHNGI